MSSISPLHPLSPVTYHTPGPASGTPVYFDSIGSSMYNSGYSGVSHSGGQGGGGYLEEETGVVQEGVDVSFPTLSLQQKRDIPWAQADFPGERSLYRPEASSGGPPPWRLQLQRYARC